MSVRAPEWLSKRGGDFKPGSDGITWLVLLDQQPQYMITPVPVGGKHGCQVKQTNNGKRFDCTTTFTTTDEALQGGLENLRKSLGW